MLLDITNTCRMGCPHCMQRSTPEPQHMTDETFDMALRFIGKCEPEYVLVSGGEPTEHTKWVAYTEILASAGYKIIMPTNGMWIGTPKETEMMGLLNRKKDIVLQITTVDGIYPHHRETMENIAGLKKRFKSYGLKHRIVVADEIESMVELGRCCDHPELADIARKNDRGTTSCFMAALNSAQAGLKDVIRIMEERVKLCHPLVDWRGNIHWSESWLCPAFAHVSEDFDEIARKARAWRPCGKCNGYQKLLNRPEPKYALGRFILGI